MPQDKRDKPSFKEEKAGGGSLKQGSETKRNPTRNTGLNPSKSHMYMALNTYLIQIFLPLSDNDGNRFPQKHYADIQTMLVDRFGGLTAFMRAPATGFWADDKDKTIKDDIVIIEVQTDRLEAEWWHQYRQSLEALFSQDQILITAQSTTIL